MSKSLNQVEYGAAWVHPEVPSLRVDPEDMPPRFHDRCPRRCAHCRQRCVKIIEFNLTHPGRCETAPPPGKAKGHSFTKYFRKINTQAVR